MGAAEIEFRPDETGLDAGAVPSLEQLALRAAERLADRPHRELPRAPHERQAAVAITLIERAGVPCVPVIKRAARGRNAGHWALPGGRVEPSESSESAALRELAEETGLLCEHDDVLGRLDDITTATGHVISPWVVAAPGKRPFKRSAAEVASLHPIPVARLLAPGVPRWRETPEGSLLQMPLRHDMVIHAPTGAILWQFAEVVLRGRDVDFGHILEPAFVGR
ncbi:NUDIX hydrolase [Sinomonas terrae]|uniref:CoA pyrophosphatase n=1 Tax=Sinomonas terrae TaxID=2908838 RepID=A0ABS9TXU4_9MICC|nr:CoA pyrophosphatase [Sinomonas terrae]MCH6468910.1 CoA pyrophosphatase [Sinomonas terrae]